MLSLRANSRVKVPKLIQLSSTRTWFPFFFNPIRDIPLFLKGSKNLDNISVISGWRDPIGVALREFFSEQNKKVLLFPGDDTWIYKLWSERHFKRHFRFCHFSSILKWFLIKRRCCFWTISATKWLLLWKRLWVSLRNVELQVTDNYKNEIKSFLFLQP